MKRAVLALFLCLPVYAQSPEISRLDRMADSINQLGDRIGIITQQILLKNQIEQEFWDMTLELARLGDPTVAKIIKPHFDKINRLNNRIMKLQKGAK